MTPAFELFRSFAYTRWISRKSLSRSRFEEIQGKAVRRWLENDLKSVPAFRNASRMLTDIPKTDKSYLMANFENFNKAKISVEMVQAAMAQDFCIGDLTVGASTGTSGNRGFFIISQREKFRWLGAILAKTISDLLSKKQRIAIILPQGGSLYQSANRLPQIDLRLFDLVNGIDCWRKEIEAYNPTIIVAPPKVLRHAVVEGFRLDPVRVFAAAETLDQIDRRIIENAFNCKLGQIYMATEGLLATTCRYGRLHLAEDSVYFEFEAIGNGLVNPSITCFRRQTQILARYQMNDLLRLGKNRCECGSPMQVVDEIVGRVDDCFYVPAKTKKMEMFTPDILRNAILSSDHRIQDFRLVQTSDRVLELILDSSLPKSAAEAAEASLNSLIRHRGANATVKCHLRKLIFNPSRKLRRVENRIKPRIEV